MKVYEMFFLVRVPDTTMLFRVHNDKPFSQTEGRQYVRTWNPDAERIDFISRKMAKYFEPIFKSEKAIESS